MPPKGKGKGKGGGAPGGKAVIVEAVVEQDPEKFILNLLKKLLPDVGGEELELGAAMLAEGLADLKEAESSGNLEGVVEDLLQGAGVDTADQAGAIAKGLRVFNPLGLANPRAVVSTTAGNFTAEIFLDQMPLTSSNFVDLASSGFYDGTHIHRIVEGFMVQMGCPHSADPKAANAGEGAPPPGSSFTVLAGAEANSVVIRGTVGDESGCIPDEHDAARISNTVGTLAMANNDAPNTGGSQFFINVADNPSLDFWDCSESESKHPVFGKVTDEEGLDVIRGIAKVETDNSERPVKAIKVTKVRIV